MRAGASSIHRSYGVFDARAVAALTFSWFLPSSVKIMAQVFLARHRQCWRRAVGGEQNEQAFGVLLVKASERRSGAEESGGADAFGVQAIAACVQHGPVTLAPGQRAWIEVHPDVRFRLELIARNH